MTLEGGHEVIARECRGEPFLFLNDLTFGPNGDLFVTDSGDPIRRARFGWRARAELPRLEVRRSRVSDRHKTREVEIVDRGFQFANGVAFGPDGHLYVNETLSGNIYRYACRNGVVTGTRELFGNVIERFNAAELKLPDGMKFGADGQLYVAVFGQGDVTVLSTRGEVARRIKTRGMYPTNLAFFQKRMYVTGAETGTLQTHDVETAGFPLHL